jgi:hypothetical protein
MTESHIFGVLSVVHGLFFGPFLDLDQRPPTSLVGLLSSKTPETFASPHGVSTRNFIQTLGVPRFPDNEQVSTQHLDIQVHPSTTCREMGQHYGVPVGVVFVDLNYPTSLRLVDLLQQIAFGIKEQLLDGSDPRNRWF